MTNKTIYLDNASTSYPKAPKTGAAVGAFIENCGGSPDRSGTFHDPFGTESIISETRKRLHNFFKADSNKQVVFTSGATAALNILMRGLLRENDHVVVSSMEHHAVMRTLVSLNRYGVSYTAVKADKEGGVRASDFEKAIKPETKLVIANHASNVCGTILPIEEIYEVAKKHNVYFAADCAQTAGVIPSVSAQSADCIVFAGHKGLMAPQGIGGFVVSKKLGNEMNAPFTGGTGIYSNLYTMPNELPYKFEAGTLNLAGIAGLNHSLKFVNSIGTDNIYKKELELTRLLLGGLAELPVKIIGRRDLNNRVGVVSFVAPYSNNKILTQRMEEKGIILRYGLHCAPKAHETLGTLDTGTIRLSVGYFNTKEEIYKAIDVIGSLV